MSDSAPPYTPPFHAISSSPLVTPTEFHLAQTVEPAGASTSTTAASACARPRRRLASTRHSSGSAGTISTISSSRSSSRSSRGGSGSRGNSCSTYCTNCGEHGHTFKRCRQPIISIGVVSFHVADSCLDRSDALRAVARKCSQEHELAHFFLNNAPDKAPSTIRANDIRFLMIRRKNSLGYMEFMRGRYQPTRQETLVKLFRLMVASEIEQLRQTAFDDLWHQLWHKNSRHVQQEYGTSRRKFLAIRESGLMDRLCTQVDPLYTSPEWGFPKGRRNLYESDLDCGIREFAEETGYTRSDIQVLDRCEPRSETFMGTNSIPYKHIYYVSHCLFAQRTEVLANNHEIGDMGWFTLAEAVKLIRHRHGDRRELLVDLHAQIMTWFNDSATTAAVDIQTPHIDMFS